MSSMDRGPRARCAWRFPTFIPQRSSSCVKRLPVLVHCHAGVGRAALTASAYLMAGGLSYAEAFGQIRRARPIVVLNEIQHARLLEWERLARDEQIVDPLRSPIVS